MFQSINSIEFSKKFRNNEDCYQYLIGIKWAKGFQCSRCGCNEFYKGRTYYYRRCKSCYYDESVTANTIFHGMKVPILKAFHMVFRLTAKKKGMSTTELGAEVGVEQKTAWLFKRKIQAAMTRDKNDKLNGTVEIDETLIGGYSSAKGRSTQTKQAVLIAVETLSDGRTGNVAIRPIENFTAVELKYAIKELVDDRAQIKTDRFQSYKSLSNQLSITTSHSENGSGLEQLHLQIMQFKNWLRGTHHKCSRQHQFAYNDEYVYRFNKRNMRPWIFNDLINRIMHQIPHPYNYLKTLCVYST